MNSIQLPIIIVFTISSYVLITGNAMENSWLGDIETRKMFVGQRIASMRDLLKDDPEIKDIDSFISEYPHLMYAVMKCKYADSVVDMLDMFYETIQFSLEAETGDAETGDAETYAPRTALIKTIISHFIDTKPHFVRILYNLFSYSDQDPKLRTSEQHFSKTILSINLFLYHNRRYNSFIVDQQSTTAAGGDENGTGEYHEKFQMTRATNVARVFMNFIVQIVGLINWFRLKNCFVDDASSNTREFGTDLNKFYKVKDVDVVTGLLQIKTGVLESLAVRTPVNLNRYYEEMYDPESLLLGDLFSFGPPIVAKATVTFEGKDFSLANVYETVKRSYDLDSVLEYQNCLFETISNLFARQIDECSTIDGLKSLHRALRMFASFVLPVNCASAACTFMDSVKRTMHVHIVKYDRAKTYGRQDQIDKTKEELRAFYDGKCWESEDGVQDVLSVSLPDFVYEIYRNEQFRSFRHVVTLLSYESEANGRHGLFEVDGLSSEVTTDEVGEAGYEMFRLRSVLLPFSVLSNLSVGDASEISEYDFKQAFKFAALSAIDVYDRHGKKDDRVSDVLLPLLTHFRYVNHPSCEHSRFVRLRLEHVALFAIVAIDDYLSRVHRRPLHDSRWRLARRSDPTASLISLRDSCPAVVGANDDDFVTDRLDELYGRLFYHDEMLESLSVDRSVRFYWNGANELASEALRDAPRAVNDAQDLVRYRWLGCRWLAARVFLKMKYVLMKAGELENRLGDQYRITLIGTAARFEELDVPPTMGPFFKDTIRRFVTALSVKSPIFDDDLVDFALLSVNRSIEMLGAAANQLSYDEMDKIIVDLNVDFEQFVVTIEFLKIDQVLYSDKTNFFSTVYPF